MNSQTTTHTKGTTPMKAKGFTLIELAVVLAVIAVLAAILTPLVTAYIDQARTTPRRVGRSGDRPGVPAAQTRHGTVPDLRRRLEFRQRHGGRRRPDGRRNHSAGRHGYYRVAKFCDVGRPRCTPQHEQVESPDEQPGPRPNRLPWALHRDDQRGPMGERLPRKRRAPDPSLHQHRVRALGGTGRQHRYPCRPGIHRYAECGRRRHRCPDQVGQLPKSVSSRCETPGDLVVTRPERITDVGLIKHETTAYSDRTPVVLGIIAILAGILTPRHLRLVRKKTAAR